MPITRLPTPEELYPDIKKRKPTSLVAQQAKRYGYTIPEDWILNFDYEGEEPKPILVSPEKWEFRDLRYGDEGLQDYQAFSPEGKRYNKAELEAFETGQEKRPPLEPEIKPPTGAEFFPEGVSEPRTMLLRNLYPEMFAPEASYGFSEEEKPQMAWDTLMRQLEESPADFAQQLQAKGRSRYSEALLRELGATPEGIEEFYTFEVPPTEEVIPPEIEIPAPEEVGLSGSLRVFGQALTKIPKQLGATILQAIQGQGGASVVDKNWADRFIEEANTDIEKFTQEVSEKYEAAGLPISLTDLAQLPRNIAYSLTSMGAGIAAGVPVALLPVPGARVAAWGIGSAASGATAYSMTTYQIMQQFLEAKNEEKIAATGKGLTIQEENRLKDDFDSKAREYGLWEAVPEAISNLAFAKILTTPLTKIVGKGIAVKILGKLSSLYGEELLTETITQKGQSAIEVEAGLREGRIDWLEAFKEVAPQTFLLTTILGGVGQVGVSAVTKVKQSLTNEIGEKHPLYETIIGNLKGNIKEALKTPERGAIGKPAETLKKLSTPADTELLKTAQVQASKVGLDLDAIRGISEGEYWVSLTTSKKNKEGFTDWLVELRNKNPETANAVEKALSGKFEFKETEPAWGRGRFIPFKTLQDARQFLATGDMSLVAKEIKLRGQAWTPEQLAQTRLAAQQDIERRTQGLAPLQQQITQLQEQINALEPTIKAEQDIDKWKVLRAERDKLETELQGLKTQYAQATLKPIPPIIPKEGKIIPKKEPWQMTWDEIKAVRKQELANSPQQLAKVEQDFAEVRRLFDETRIKETKRIKAINTRINRLNPTGEIDKVDTASQRVISKLEAERDALVSKHRNENIPNRGQYVSANLPKSTIPPSQKMHLESIQQALSEGKPVPAEVLKDYPTKPAPARPELAERVTPEVTKGIVPIAKEELPLGWQMGIGQTRTKEGHTAEAEIDWKNKRIVFRDKESMSNPEIVNHEIAHVRLEELPDNVKDKLLDEYAELKEGEWKVKGYTKEWITKNKFHREEIIIDHTQYLTDASKLEPEIKAFFDRELPQVAIPKAPVTPEVTKEPVWLEKEVLAKDIELPNVLYRTREITGLGADYKGVIHFETDAARALVYADKTTSKAVDRYRIKPDAKIYDENISGVISKANLKESSGGADIVITKSPNTETLVLNEKAIEKIQWGKAIPKAEVVPAPVTPEVTEVSISAIRTTNNEQTLEQAIINVKDGLVPRTEGEVLLTKNPDGTYTINDGFHRIAQAILNKEGTIKATIRQVPEIVIPKAEAVTPPAEVAPTLIETPPETTLPMPDNVTVSEDRVVRPPPPPEVPPPLEPPTIHPPQPAPIEDNRLVMPDLQPSQQVIDLYSKPDFWRRVANLPLVKKAVGLFNPAAVANDPARQAIILRAVLKDEAAQKAQAVISHVWEIGTQDRVWGKTDEMGLLKSEPFTGISIDDIRTNPEKFSAQMTDKQKEWIKRADEVERAKLDALKRNEIEINELSFEDGGQYAGRRVMGKFNDSGELIESGRIGIGGRVGAKMPFEKTRVFKEASDGISAGYRYMNSDEALYYNVLGAYNKIADRQMAEWILTKVDWRTTAAPEALVLQAESAHIRLRKAQQLLAALNRAIRGERVPSNTINSIANAYPDQAQILKDLIPELQKPSPEVASTVKIVDAEAKALIAQAKVEYYQAVDKRARAREEALRVKYEESSIAHPAFQGKIFTGTEAKEIADILRKGLQPQFIEALGAVNKVNAIGRFFMLAGDASPMAIQLQFLSFYRPKAYVKAWGGFVRAMFDPEFQYRQYANNRDLINKHPTLILSGRGTEFTEFMGRGGLGRKLGVVAKPLIPFQKAFEGCMDTAGIELAKSLDHLCTTPERTLEVDQFINEFRGVTSSARIGVSSTQRQVETAILLAPRYNRAIAGYLFDVVHGGLRGHLARMSLAAGFAGLAAMAVAISIALGEDEDETWEHFNPESPKFFTWDVMGVKVGLGGKVRSVIKLFGNMTRTGEVGQPALNFLRGNLAPGASTGLDLITGKNYIGEPTRDNVLDFTKTVGRNFMMIWTQSFLMEGGTLKDKAIIATAEFLGLRGYDISASKETKIKDLEEQLGQQIGKTPLLTKKKPDIYDTRNIYSDIKRLLQYTPPEEVLADKGYTGLGHLVVKIEQSEGNKLPDIALRDYNFDPAKGDTMSDYMRQWAERQRITEDGEKAEYTRVKIVEGKEERTEFKGLAALIAHKQDYPKAQLGNLTRRQRKLLLEYNTAVNKKQFVKDNPDIKINPKTEWLKANPKDNAEFAIFGQVSILTKEAYNQFLGLVKALDIPDSAIPPLTLPPATSIDTHFKYEEMVSEGTHGSWEAQLLLKQDALKAKDAKVQSYADWQELKLSDTPTSSLEIKTKPEFRTIYDKIQNLGAKDSLDYIADEKARAEAIKKLKTSIYIDDTRRIEAIEKGTDKAPIDEREVNAHVAYGKLIDQEGVGSSSAEVMLYRVDNPDYDTWRMDKDVWGDNALSPIDESRIPIWRIDVKYAKEDTEYNAIKNPLPREQARLRDEYMVAHPKYRMDSRRREGYGLTNSKTGEKFPTTEVENYVGYYELPTKGFRQERFLIENPEFAQVMHSIKGMDLPTKVPAVQYDDIYDQYKKQFDELENLANNESEYYIEDVDERKNRAKTLRFTGRRYNNFGLAEMRREGYSKFVPENQVENYVAYYKIVGEGKPKGQDKWYADDWFLMEHPEFYQNVYKILLGNQKRDFRKVPTKEVFGMYQRYLGLIEGKPRDDFRWEHPALDDWLVTLGYKSITEQKRRAALTPKERISETIAETERRLREHP